MFAALKDLMKVVSVASDYSAGPWHRVEGRDLWSSRRKREAFLTKGFRNYSGNSGVGGCCFCQCILFSVRQRLMLQEKMMNEKMMPRQKMTELSVWALTLLVK